MLRDIKYMSIELEAYLSEHKYFEKVRNAVNELYDAHVTEIHVDHEYFSSFSETSDNYTALLSFGSGKGRFFVYYNFSYNKLNEKWESIDLFKETGTVYFDFPDKIQDESSVFKLKANILYEKR